MPGLIRTVALLNGAKIFVPSERRARADRDMEYPVAGILTEEVDGLVVVWSEGRTGADKGPTVEELLFEIKSRLESERTVSIPSSEAAAACAIMASRVVQSGQNAVSELYSRFDADGKGLRKSEVLSILSSVDQKKCLAKASMEHVYSCMVEEKMKATTAEKLQARRARGSAEEAKLEDELRIKHKTVAEVLSNRWLVHLTFWRLLGVDMKSLIVVTQSAGSATAKGTAPPTGAAKQVL